MTDYIPITPEQKYFKQPDFPSVITKEIGEATTSAYTTPPVQTAPPKLNLAQPQFAEPKDNGSGNKIWQWLLIGGVVVAVIYCGRSLYKKKKQNDQQQAQALRQQFDNELKAIKSKAKDDQGPNDTTSDSTPPQLP